jgi:Flp pilus assembly protein TadD
MALFLLVVMLAPVGQQGTVGAESAHSYTTRAMSNAMQGKDDQAIADFNKALEIDPNNKRTYNFRASYYMMKKQYNLAIADFNKCVELNPNDTSALNNLAVAHHLNKDYDKAWETVYKIKSLGGKVPRNLLKNLRQDSGRKK